MTYDDKRLCEIHEQLVAETIPVISAPRGMNLSAEMISNLCNCCRSAWRHGDAKRTVHLKATKLSRLNHRPRHSDRIKVWLDGISKLAV